MTFKTIVINLNVHNNHSKGLIRKAISIGERFGSHLIGVLVQPADPFPIYAESRLPKVVLQMYQDLQTERAEKTRRGFERQMADSDCSFEFLDLRGHTDEKIIQVARCADLIMTLHNGNGKLEAEDMSTESGIILGASCPVLVVPAGCTPEFFGRRVMLAWDGSKEVARAIKSAVGVLKTSSYVEIVSVAKNTATESPEHEDIRDFLSRHGVEAKSEILNQTSLSVADQIIERIPKCAADLLIMGGYGHNRLREMVLGGTTLELLKAAPIPILLEH